MLGLLVLPVTRNSVWSVAFGLSRDVMVKVHQGLGNLLVLLVASHALLMYLACQAKGLTPFTAFPDNYTVGLVVCASCLALVAVGVLAREAVRSRHYELFLGFHIVSMAVLVPVAMMVCGRVISTWGSWAV